MQFFFQPLNHIRAVRAWAVAAGARFAVSGDDFSLTIWRGERRLRLRPRFTTRNGTLLAYTEDIDRAIGFVGWSPAGVRTWPISADKLAFKNHCLAAGLAAPELAPIDGPVPFPYLLKPRSGSFGAGILGPFAPTAGAPPGLRDGHLVERFVAGRAAKCWYWNARPVALEVLQPPYVTGDGVRTIAQLLSEPRGSFDRALALEEALPMLALHALGPDTVPAAGTQVLLGYRYVTPFDRMTLLDRDCWPTADPTWRAAFARAGAVAHAALPPEFQGDAVFTLDAVIADDGTAWWLEMNSHPMLHPALYAPMLDDLLGGPDEPAR
jgi:hypothetical protein